jgi:argininosuccinate lyase/amino-acid N-acetyltransferase
MPTDAPSRMTEPKQHKAMWGGRFAGASDPLFRDLNDSLRFDYRLVAQDVRGSIAWARALARAQVLTAEEAERLAEALGAVADLAAANPRAVSEGAEEDVHSWVEARLIERVGDLGKKLHTGRSRNDQVATDLRLFTRDEIAARIAELRAAQGALLRLAEREIDTPFPAYTHLQRAQPVLLAHWCLAHVEALERDAERLAGAAKRANLCPLGAGALAGTAYPIDRAALAADLGFDGPTPNSLDAVSDRDFVFETLAACALTGVHLSRLGEDLIIYSSAEFGLIEMSDAVTSGSSLMPQKKNPDAMELLRGKSGRLIGALVSLAVTLKGLPASYNKDLQEDKEPLFDAMTTLSLCLRVIPPAIDGVTVDRDRARDAAVGGFANATELADYLVGKGRAFRDAHEAAGRAVRIALEKGCALDDLSLDDLRAIDDRIDNDVYDRLSLDSVLAMRDVVGGTAPGRVADALTHAQQRLAAHNAENTR